MAKQTGDMFYPRRGATLKGVSYVSERVAGQVVSKWPKPFGPARSPAQKLAQETFSRAMLVIKNMDGATVDMAIEVSKGAPLLPRDLLMVQLYARWCYFVMPDGRKVFPMAAMQDVSLLLDTIYQTPGGILFRDTALWKGLPLGAAGQLLAVGAGGLPEWEDAPTVPVTGGNAFLGAPFLRPDAALTMGTDIFICLPIIPNDDLPLNGVKIRLGAIGTSRTLLAGLYSDGGNTPVGGGLLAYSPAQACVLGVNTIPFSVAYTVLKDHVYWLGLCIKGGSGNVQPNVSDLTRNGYYYWSQATTTLPATAPAATVGTGATQFTWWAY